MKRINIALMSLFLVHFLCLSFTLATQKEIGRDGVYVVYANGIVWDTKAGLEWKAGPDKNTNWNQVRSWVQNLNLDDGGWRMPTTDELRTLYKIDTGSRNMTPLLKTTGWYVWSGETKEGSSLAKYVGFHAGDWVWHNRLDSHNLRGFAVRSRND